MISLVLHESVQKLDGSAYIYGSAAFDSRASAGIARILRGSLWGYPRGSEA